MRRQRKKSPTGTDATCGLDLENISRIDIGLLEAGFQIPLKLNVDIKSLHFRPRPIRAELTRKVTAL